MTADERAHLERVLDAHRRRLRELEVSAARTGFNTPPEVTGEISEIREQILAVTRQLTDLLPPGHVPVDLVSYPDALGPAGGRLRVDWSQWFAPAPPTPEIWQAELLPALRGVVQQLNRHASRLIALRIKAHLSAALAFGYALRGTSGFQIWVEQAPGTWWRGSGPAAEETPLLASEPDAAAEGDIAIDVSVARDASAAVRAYLADQAVPIGRRIHLAPVGGPGQDAVRDASHALAMVKQIRALLEAVRAERPRETIHLFVAAPVGLAVLIGAQLNACEPVQCYEFARPANVYVPAALLTP